VRRFKIRQLTDSGTVLLLMRRHRSTVGAPDGDYDGKLSLMSDDAKTKNKLCALAVL